MRYIVEFFAKDENKKCSYMLHNLEDAIALGMCLAREKTFTIWIEREVAEHYISWDILTTIQEFCCEYVNGEKVRKEK